MCVCVYIYTSIIFCIYHDMSRKHQANSKKCDVLYKVYSIKSLLVCVRVCVCVVLLSHILLSWFKAFIFVFDWFESWMVDECAFWIEAKLLSLRRKHGGRAPSHPDPWPLTSTATLCDSDAVLTTWTWRGVVQSKWRPGADHTHTRANTHYYRQTDRQCQPLAVCDN